MMVCNGGTGFFVGGHADMQSDGMMEQDVWNNITITYDGELLRIYINGEFDKKDPPGLKWGIRQGNWLLCWTTGVLGR